MKTVLFIILPYPSHYNACFGLAHELKKRAYRVVFTGYPHLRSQVEQQGYEFCALNYTTEYTIRTLKSFVTRILYSLLDRSNVVKRFRVWYKSIMDVRSICAYYQAEQIFIDAHLSHYYLYLYDFRKSITVLSTKLSTKKSPGFPPLNSFFIPSDTASSKLICEFLWMRYTIKTEIRRWINKVAFLGRDEAYFQRRLCEKYHVKWGDIFEKQNTSFIGLKNVPTLILGTELLEFPQRKKLPHESYLHLPIQRNEEKYLSEEYRRIKERILALKLQSNYHVIYCSFGTLSNLNHKKVGSFIRKLVNAIRLCEDIMLVISSGKLNLNIPFDSERIVVLKQVPQLDMLKCSDMMITHGGHNSIKECLQAGVPMLIYPLNEEVDQPGNAVRVFVNGYGLFGKIEKDRPKDILSKIKRVLSMKGEMKNCESINYHAYFSHCSPITSSSTKS